VEQDKYGVIIFYVRQHMTPGNGFHRKRLGNFFFENTAQQSCAFTLNKNENSVQSRKASFQYINAVVVTY
jgi:hypothetical protein